MGHSLLAFVGFVGAMWGHRRGAARSAVVVRWLVVELGDKRNLISSLSGGARPGGLQLVWSHHHANPLAADRYR